MEASVIGQPAVGSDEMLRKLAGDPLQVVQLDMDNNVVVPVLDNLHVIEKNLKETKASKVAILAIMGAYRTGKSFLLDLLMRYLSETDGCATQEMSEATFWQFGDQAEKPSWVGAGGELLEGHDDDQFGFRWRPGMDKCTEGIWIWSKPFIRMIKNERVALLLMDTQGAWDSRMTKEQSATVFGLTAILSSKLIYNIQNRIQEDKIDNLDYFTTFATTVLRDLPASYNLDDFNRPVDTRCFQDLEFLVRDWEYFEEGWDVDQCRKQMKEHLMKHMGRVLNENSQRRETVERLQTIFASIRCWGLPHPGKKIPKSTWTGSVNDLDVDFVQLLDVYARRLFDSSDFCPKKILGRDLKPDSFVEVFTVFANAFKDARPDAVSLRGAFVSVEVFKAKEEIMTEFNKKMEDHMLSELTMDPDYLKGVSKAAVDSSCELFKERIRPFALDNEQEKIDDLRDVLVQHLDKYVDRNRARLTATQYKAGCFLGVAAVFCAPVLNIVASVKAVFLGIGAVAGGIGHLSLRASEEGNLLSAAQRVGEDVAQFTKNRFQDMKEIQIGMKSCAANPPSMNQFGTAASAVAATRSAASANRG